jgi:hypothetical protein
MSVTRFLTVQISGEEKRVDKYTELIEMEVKTSVAFWDAMFHSADPGCVCPVVQIHETKAE